MNLKYKITLEDYLEFYRRESKDFYNNIWLRSLSSIIIVGCFIFGIYIIYSGIARYSGEISSIFWGIFISCFFFGLGIFIWFIFDPESRAKSRFKELKKHLNENKKPSLIAERNITVNKNGLSFEAETLHIFVDWDLFNYVSETDRLLILHFHEGKESQIIPKRCFENSEEIDRFQKLLQNKAKNSDNNSLLTEKIAEKDGILKLEYQLEAKDYLEAEQANRIDKKWLIWYYPIAIPFLLGVGFNYLWEGIYGFSLLESDLSQKDALINAFLYLGIGFNWLLTTYPKIDIFQRKKIAKNWNNNKPMQSDRKLIVTENEIVLMSDYFQESIDWQEYLKYIENKKIFLLYYSEKDYQIVPKKIFENREKIKQFRELIESHNNITKISL